MTTSYWRRGRPASWSPEGKSSRCARGERVWAKRTRTCATAKCGSRDSRSPPICRAATTTRRPHAPASCCSTGRKSGSSSAARAVKDSPSCRSSSTSRTALPRWRSRSPRRRSSTIARRAEAACGGAGARARRKGETDMSVLVWALLATVAPPLPPQVVVIATPRGETSVPVTTERGTAAVAALRLGPPLGLTAVLDGSRVTVGLSGAVFVFQLGAAFVRAGGVVYGLVGEPYVARDSVFLPLQWLADCVPRALGGRYRWDPGSGGGTGRLVALPIADSPPAATAAPSSAPNPITGLRHRHAIVIDPGHGGVDPGNPGRYFPGHLVEKDITLAI